MFKVQNVLFVIFFLCPSFLFSQLVVHVQNPWKDEATYNDQLRIVGMLPDLGTTTWEGGAKLMKDEGVNGWYSYTFTSGKANTGAIKIVRWLGNSWTTESMAIGSLSSLFTGSTDEQIHVWVTFEPGLTTTFDPLDVGATVINVLNPWPENSPSIIVGADTTQMLINSTHTGWYSFFYMGARDPLSVSFTDYFHSEAFGQNGKLSPIFEEIDLAPYKDSGNTLFIWPEPKYDGPAKVSGQFPGVLGEANTLVITALVHDHSINESDFEENFSSDNVTLGIAGDELSPTGKIQNGPNVATAVDANGKKIVPSGDITSWFEHSDVTDTCIDLVLTKSDNGGWEYSSDKTNGFFPIDDWDPFGDGLYMGHNFSFTMELRTQFDYHEGKGQVFEFDGDDDVWVYVNGKLAIDLGGPHPAKTGSVNLDTEKTNFGLEDGKTYNLDMFYCERECWEPGPNESANFRMKTTINLENVSSLFTEENVNGDEIEINIKKIELGEFSADCGINVADSGDVDTNNAVIETYILFGAQFGSEGDTLNIGTNYGGIVISGNKIIIASDDISGLATGEYVIMYIDNAKFSGTYKFTVEGVSPLTVDTSGTAVSSGSSVEYAKNSITAGFTTESNCEIHYEIVSGTASVSGAGIFAGSGNIDMLSDTVVVKAYAVGDSTAPHMKKGPEEIFTFIKVLPDAILEANPGIKNGTYTFTTGSLKIGLETNDTAGAKIYWTLDGSDPDTTKNLWTGDSIEITGSDTLKAMAIVPLHNTVTAQWIYIQQLPDAKLTATPSTDPVHVYNTQFLDVLLETDIGNKIVYYMIAGSDTLATGTSDSQSVSIQISGDVTISAYTIGSNYKSVNGQWEYDCDLPTLTVEADPQDTMFQMFLDVVLSATNADTVVNAQIKYILDSTGAGFTAADVKANGVIYDPAVGLNIDKSVVVWVSAVDLNGDYSDGFGSFTYTLDLVGIQINANPSEDPYMGIGYLLDSIKLSTVPWDGVMIKWVVSTDSIVDSATLASGTIYDDITYPKIVTNDSVDSYYLSVMATGHGYETAIKVFKYVRQYLPDVQADPSDPGGYKFFNDVDVKLFVDSTLGNFKNVKIHYFLDTIKLGAQANESNDAMANYTELNITETIYIKAMATADNAVSSKASTFYYILAAGVEGAWYKDESAGVASDSVDGHIDGVTINLSMDVTVKPDSALFISPFDNSETIVAMGDDIDFEPGDNSKLIISLPRLFGYDPRVGSTEIDPVKTPKLGKLYGKYYVEDNFNIEDSVAPLIQKAVYRPGAGVLIGDSLQIASDTLTVVFSEIVKSTSLAGNQIEPAEFYSKAKMMNYDMELNYLSHSENVYNYEIEFGSNEFPVKQGDSLRVDVTFDIEDQFGNRQSVEGNRYGFIDATKPKVFYKLESTSPVIASKHSIPVNVKKGYLADVNNGLMIVVDFYKVVDTTEMTGASAVIFDQVGNKLASINGFGKNSNMAVDIVTVDNPKSKSMIVFVWDGTNQLGREVSPGTYIVQLEFVDFNGDIVSETIAVGIAQ